MRKIIIAFTIGFSISAYCQQYELIDGDYTYTKVIEIKKSKPEIYSVIKRWINDSSEKSKYVIDQDDPESGIISFNQTLPTMEYMYQRTSRVSYKVNIDIKDNKVRYRVNNIIFNNNWSLLNMPDIKQGYSSFLNDIKNEKEKLDLNKTLFDKETKKRQKNIYQGEYYNARNNLRSLNEINDVLNKQILIGEQIINDKLNQKDDW